MIETITADFNTLMRQASMTTADYLDAAIERIDEKFGKGFSERNPALVGAFINASAVDLAAAVLAQQVREGLEEISRETRSGLDGVAEKVSQVADVLENVAENVRSDHPIMADGEIGTALQNIAAMLDLYACGRSVPTR